MRQSSTIIYIPPAHRPVRSFRFYRYYIITALVLILLTFTTLYLVQYRQTLDAKTRIEWLNTQMDRERTQHSTMLAEKDSMIEHLQQNVYDLSLAAEQIEAQMNDLKQLEQDIRELSEESDLMLDSFDGEDNAVSTDQMGGKAHPLNEVVIHGWTSDTKQTFANLESELQHLTDMLFEARTSLQHIDAIRRQTPSIWPTASTQVSSSYGIRKDPFTQRLTMHSGIDIAGDLGDPIYATADGTVTETGKDGIRGNYITISHREGLQTVYMHLNKIDVTIDEQVSKGNKIGTMGSTGRSTGVHLHYEVHEDNQAVNPNIYMTDP